jgi:CRP/FNR family cyclic AMP-dependent transcriptional regulator
MIKNMNELKKIKFFSDFEEANAEKIIEISDLKEFKVNDVIIEEYQKLSELYILVEGLVILGINVPAKGRINVDTIHPGQIFSWSAIFPPYISTAYAIATQPVKVLAIKASELIKLMNNNHTFGFKIMKIIGKTLSQRLADTRFQLVNIITMT